MKSAGRVNNESPVFNDKRRIRLGIWGLGRGMSFFKACQFLNIDVVAGCDFNPHMRERFKAALPNAFLTDDEDEFLSQDFDAVLLATFCLEHTPHALKCLQAGKHVLSEVTSFANMAQGVQLVEAVEKSGLVYNLAENYPFNATNSWLANRWREGLFGDFVYGEYEYVHECRTLSYTYTDFTPVVPGHQVHHWRSWFDYHYYCTHSLGPVMVITGTRPVAVQAFPCTPRIAGYLPNTPRGRMTPSMIQMNNGGVMRNLMGSSTSDTGNQRLWGTLGASEIGRDGVRLRLGSAGHAPLLKIKPKWEGLGELAVQSGHGGGDFWVLYYFAREILTGEKAPFDIYGGCDVTIPGIQAIRSTQEDGKVMEVPDFRKKSDRDRYRSDDWQQPAYDTKGGVFGGFVPAPATAAGRFSSVMKDLITTAIDYRAWRDWKSVADVLEKPCDYLTVAEQLLQRYPILRDTYREARQIIEEHPDSDGATVLREMLEVGDEEKALAPSFLPALKREVAALRRKYGKVASEMIVRYETTALLPIRKALKEIKYPDKGTIFSKAPFNAMHNYCSIYDRYSADVNKNGLVYGRCHHTVKKAGKGVMHVAADGPFKVFLNGREIFCNNRATNPIAKSVSQIPVRWRTGKNEIVVALRTNMGRAWGFFVTV